MSRCIDRSLQKATFMQRHQSTKLGAVPQLHYSEPKFKGRLGINMIPKQYYIAGQGGIATSTTVVLWLLREMKGNTSCHCKYRVCLLLLQASARARIYEDEATADGIVGWCWCCCGPTTRTRTQNQCLCCLWVVDIEGT